MTVHSRVFEDIGIYLEDVRALTDAAGTPEPVRVALVSPSLFPVLGATPHLGRFPAAADADASGRGGLFISHDLWVRRYRADPDIVGRTIEIDRRRDVVVGVAQPGFHFPDFETQVWIGWPPEGLLARYGGPQADVQGLYMSGVARMRHGTSLEQAELLVAAVGGALGLALAHVAVDLRFGFAPEQIPRLGEVAVDRAGLGLAVGLSLLTGVLLTAVSLQSARRPGGAGTLGGGLGRMTAGRAEQAKRRLLVTAQIALACTLLIGSALMARSYWRLQQVELGFEPEVGLTFFLPLPSREYADYVAMARVHQEVLHRIRTLPGVEAAEAATVAAFPLTPVPDYFSDRVTVADAAADSAAAPYAIFGLATPGYFRAMNIPLLQGRGFQGIDATREAPDVILSAALAQALFPDGEPIGRQVRLASTAERSYTVVGVVGDVPSRAIDEGPSQVVYLPNLYPARADTATDAVPSFSPREEQYASSASSSTR